MKKRLTAWMLALCMVCAAMPAVLATDGETEQDVTIGGADVSALTEQSLVEGVTYVDLSKYEIPEDADILEVELVSGKLTQEEKAELELSEPISMERSAETAQSDTATTQKSTATSTTTDFTTYGDQLSNIGLVLDDGSVVTGFGTIMTTLYNNCKEEVEEGTSSAYFTGDESAMQDLGVSFTISNSTESERLSIMQAMLVLVYESLDYDSPEMFYSNSNAAMWYSISGSTCYMAIYPMYSAGYETLSARKSLNSKLEEQVDEIIDEASQYTRAYDTMKLIHDWLCENNEYNDEAAASSTYSSEISGDPWSAVSALLSSSDSSIDDPVCEGYSRAFQLLCDEAGITTAIITSYDHMWNNVRYGQYWTGVDVTWDDNDSGYDYDYFFVKVNGMSGHTLNAEEFTYLEYPELSVISDSSELPFYDSKSSDWHRSAIQYVYDNGIMAGTTCVIFNVSGTLTRSQFAVILYNLAGRPDVTYTSKFSDVPSGKWYTEACLWLADEGIASGYPNGKFGVSDEITREQIAQMLYAQAGSPSTSYDLSATFTDASSVSSWAQAAMQWAVATGVMSGKGDGTLAPLATATRVEGAAIMKNIA